MLKKQWLRWVLIVIAVLMLVIVVVAVTFRVVNRTNGKIVSAGETRKYYLYVPESYDPAEPVPLMLSFHGYSDWPAHHMRMTGWNDLADEHGFIVVYPSGTDFPLRWRSGRVFPGDDPMQEIRFVSDLIDKLEAVYNIDSERIYINGFSNGGGMTFLLSCEMADRFAAFGTVAGAFALDWESCQPSKPLPAIIFHGTGDPVVRFEGEEPNSLGYSLPDIRGWVTTLAERSGCKPAPETSSPAEGVSQAFYSGCDQDTEVQFYTINGSGHVWPGGGWLPKVIVGEYTDAVDATALMWAFFSKYP
jgi:polyhydroxybutyrate depolymerase